MPNHRHRRAIAPIIPLREFALWMILSACAIVAAFVFVTVLPAGAQTEGIPQILPPAVPTFDFGPLVLEILGVVAPALATVISLLGLWVLKRIASWLGLKIDDSRRAALEQALAHAVSFALEKVGDRARGGIPLDVKHKAIYSAMLYAQQSIPGALEHFNITSDRLEDMIESRLQGLVLDPNAPDQVVSRVLPHPIQS